MRILSFADIRFPLERANGIQTMATAHALAARGHDVRLVVRPDIARPPRDPIAFYGLPPAPGLTIAPVPVAGPHGLRRVEYLAWAAAAILFRRADVVLTRDLGVAVALLGVPRRLRPPVVYESHGFAPVFARTLPELVSGARAAGLAKLDRLERRERAVWRGADGYVATTRVLIDDLTANFGAREAVAVAGNGVWLDDDRTWSERPGPSPSVVAYAGHLYPWKGCDVLVRALASLPDVRGLVIGGHPAESDLARVNALARELGVDGRLTVTGLLPPADVRARLSEASVLALPTTATPSARYSCPLKMFEYMASGRPIVASDLPAVREVLADGVNALLVPPDDPGALAAAVRRLVTEPDLARRLARRAFDDVGDHSWARRAERLEALFARCSR